MIPKYAPAYLIKNASTVQTPSIKELFLSFFWITSVNEKPYITMKKINGISLHVYLYTNKNPALKNRSVTKNVLL